MNAIKRLTRKKDVLKRHVYNTKILLETYRKVNFYVNDRFMVKDYEVYNQKREQMKETIISFLEIDNRINVRRLEDSLFDINLSLTLLDMMDLALERLRNYPKNGNIYADLLWYRYFSEEEYTCENLVSKLCMSHSTYFRYSNLAIETYAHMLFGYAIPEIQNCLATIRDMPLVSEDPEPYE